MKKRRIVEDQVCKLNESNYQGLKALSFFSGAMGLDIGLSKAGIKTLLACEIDKASRETIVRNSPKIGLIGDIRNYSIKEILEYSSVANKEEIDLIVGGPPCQAFSTAGKRKGFEDERGNVFLKFIETVEQIQPQYVVIENVRGLLSSKYGLQLDNNHNGFITKEETEIKGSALYYVVNRLIRAGYMVTFNLYNSANYGTPQIRERVVIICAKGNTKVSFLKPTHSNIQEYGLKNWRTIKDVLHDLPEEPRDGMKFPAKRLKYYRLLKAGENWRNLPIDLQKEALGKSYFLSGGKTGFYRRLSWDKPSPTIVTNPMMPATDLCHPDENRPLSIQEYKRIQEFPDEWVICGSTTERYRQIGNAIPISLGEAIGIAIKKHYNGQSGEPIKGFKYSRYKRTSDVEFRKEFEENKTKLLSPTLF